MNNTKDWEDYYKDVSDSEKVDGLLLALLKLCRKLLKRSFYIENT